MKLSKYILPLFIGATGLVSCEDKLAEINKDPNSPTVSTPEATFVSGVAYYGVAVDGYYNELDALFAQYVAGGPGVALIDDERYFVQNTDYNTEWGFSYNQALKDLRYAVDNGNEAQSAVADIFSSHIWQNIVDHYGDIPYSEALKGDQGITLPAYDEGEAVYDSLIVHLDKAIAALEATDDELGDEDVIYGGDVEKWIRFANSLKLKLLMRQSVVNPTKVSADVVELINNGIFIESSDEIAAIPFSGSDGLNYNPMYARREAGVGQFYVASNSFVNVMEALNDPRGLVLFDEAANTGTLTGLDQGFIENVTPAPSADDYSYPSEVAYAEDNDVILMSHWEVYFLRAEAALRFTTGEDAVSMYENAILSHFGYIGAPGGGAYVASEVVAIVGDGSQADLDKLAVQKWIAMCGLQEFEGFIESRRLDVPATRIFTDATSGILKRPTRSVFGAGEFPASRLYPQTETSFNPNEINQGRTSILDKIFWDN